MALVISANKEKTTPSFITPTFYSRLRPQYDRRTTALRPLYDRSATSLRPQIRQATAPPVHAHGHAYLVRLTYGPSEDYLPREKRNTAHAWLAFRYISVDGEADVVYGVGQHSFHVN
ncbi:hypothetical protein Bbelb_016920 [Branchiostoma belcheri]|nr:hypothetical protein Bbelb_016920 [Branchiostoma belcheri]